MKLGETLFNMLTILGRPADETSILNNMRSANGNLINENGEPVDKNGFGVLLDIVGNRMEALGANQRIRAIFNHFNSLTGGNTFVEIY